MSSETEEPEMTESEQTQKIETTQAWIVDNKGQTLELHKWHMLPTYRLKLTLFHIDRSIKPLRKTVLIQKDFPEPNIANAAALELAKDCRSFGESVMLVSCNESEIDLLHHYAVGTWDWEKYSSGKIPCEWNLILDFERDRLYNHMKGNWSAYVEVVRSWQSSALNKREIVALDDLQRSDEQGQPPLGLPASAPYRFGRYCMRDSCAWQPVITTTPVTRLQREKLGNLSSSFANHRLSQQPLHAWRPRNLSDIIVSLEKNTEMIQLAYHQPRDTKERFNPNTTVLENPTEIAWRHLKKSVVGKDLKTFELKLRLLRLQKASLAVGCMANRPGMERSKTIDELKLQLIRFEQLEPAEFVDAVSTTAAPALATAHVEVPRNEEPSSNRLLVRILVVLALLGTSLTRILEAFHGSLVFVSGLPGSTQEESAYTQKLSDPSICPCTAHRWRRATFPRHKPLPAVEKSTAEQTDPSNVRAWARDPTYVPRRHQHFITQPEPKPEPTTLCGYIRRQLETGSPVPRQAYIDFDVMTERGCEARWGPDWRLQCKKDREEWDDYRNVRKPRKKARVPQQADPPENELDSYGGCLLEHEMC